MALVIEHRIVPEPVGLVDGRRRGRVAAGSADPPVVGVDVVDVNDELAAGIAEVLRRVEPVLARVTRCIQIDLEPVLTSPCTAVPSGARCSSPGTNPNVLTKYCWLASMSS